MLYELVELGGLDMFHTLIRRSSWLTHWLLGSHLRLRRGVTVSANLLQCALAFRLHGDHLLTQVKQSLSLRVIQVNTAVLATCRSQLRKASWTVHRRPQQCGVIRPLRIHTPIVPEHLISK